jgi:hypothetical protein
MRPVLFIIALVGLPACGDPVRTNAIDALGDEKPGVPAGPRHRPGQPCVLCHDGSGPGNTVFSFAGTVYQTPSLKVPLGDALVKFIDAAGKKYQTGANCAGNFFVMKAEYEPTYPVWVKLVFGFQVTPTNPHEPIEHAMGSPIYREGSCASCHADKPGAESVGRVYFLPDGAPLPTEPCPP